MKRFVLATCIGASLFFAANMSFAQDSKKAAGEQKPAVKIDVKPETSQPQRANMPSHEQRAEMAVKQIAGKVTNLTADQQTKLRAVYMNAFKSQEADKETYKNDIEKMKEAAKAHFMKMRDDVKSILTKEQWEMYNKPPAPPQVKEAPKPSDTPRK
jgi:hypothetical protein